MRSFCMLADVGNKWRKKALNMNVPKTEFLIGYRLNIVFCDRKSIFALSRKIGNKIIRNYSYILDGSYV